MSGALVALGGLAGALGVALAAVAAHRGAGPGEAGAGLDTAARMLLGHAPAFLALAALAASTGRLGLGLGVGAALLALGLGLFAGDLAARAFLGGRLFPMAAPIGGALMIGGWAVIALAGALTLWPSRGA